MPTVSSSEQGSQDISFKQFIKSHLRTVRALFAKRPHLTYLIWLASKDLLMTRNMSYFTLHCVMSRLVAFNRSIRYGKFLYKSITSRQSRGKATFIDHIHWSVLGWQSRTLLFQVPSRTRPISFYENEEDNSRKHVSLHVSK